MVTGAASGRGAVMITGTSSGIGRACAIGLAKAGFRVFAGVRKQADGDALGQLAAGKLTPVLIDVTDAATVIAAAQEVAVSVGASGLAGLVNNAGIAVTWPMEAIPSDVLRKQYDINVFGQVTVIQTFMPLLRMAAGRIVNIGSIGDRITMPFGAPLTSSKSAFASITEGLRLELRPWGIHVILIEPASIHSEAVDKMEADAEQTLRQLDEIQRPTLCRRLSLDDPTGAGRGALRQQPRCRRRQRCPRPHRQEAQDPIPGRQARHRAGVDVSVWPPTGCWTKSACACSACLGPSAPCAPKTPPCFPGPNSHRHDGDLAARVPADPRSGRSTTSSWPVLGLAGPGHQGAAGGAARPFDSPVAPARPQTAGKASREKRKGWGTTEHGPIPAHRTSQDPSDERLCRDKVSPDPPMNRACWY
jgi:NAD(P)-dependent dehydrogenase (short-subunit alcohol dehydrogenase family)